MNDETGQAEGDASSSRHVSRRTVIRTAAHAVWVVPAIQVVAAAPAFAASEREVGTLEFTPLSTGSWNTGQDRMSASIRIYNSSTTDSADVILTLTFPNFYVYNASTEYALTVATTTAGWSVGPVTYTDSGASRIAKVDVTGPVASLANPTVEVRATVGWDVRHQDLTNAADSVTVLAVAPNFTGAATSVNPS